MEGSDGGKRRAAKLSPEALTLERPLSPGGLGSIEVRGSIRANQVLDRLAEFTTARETVRPYRGAASAAAPLAGCLQYWIILLMICCAPLE